MLRIGAPRAVFARAASRAAERSALLAVAGAPAGRASAVCALKLPVEPLEHGKGPVVGPQSQHPTPGVVDHARGLEHLLLDHRLDAPPLGAVA